MQNEYVSGFIQGFAAGWSGFCKDRYNLKNNDENISDYTIGFEEGLARGHAYAKMPSELVG